MTHKEINQIVARNFGCTIAEITSASQQTRIAVPRAAAMLLCRRLLRYKYRQLQKAYNKRAHSTINNAINTAKNLYATDSDFRTRFDAAHKQAIELLPAFRQNKQRYNLHYRLRQKKVKVAAKSRTVSIRADQEAIIRQNNQLASLLSKHNYSVQYSIV